MFPVGLCRARGPEEDAPCARRVATHATRPAFSQPAETVSRRSLAAGLDRRVPDRRVPLLSFEERAQQVERLSVGPTKDMSARCGRREASTRVPDVAAMTGLGPVAGGFVLANTPTLRWIDSSSRSARGWGVDGIVNS